MDAGSRGAALKRDCNRCWICKKSQTIKNLSDTALHRVYKVSPISATQKTEQFRKGVRGDFSSSSPACCRWPKPMLLLWPVTSVLRFAFRCSARHSEMVVNDDQIHVIPAVQLNAEKCAPLTVAALCRLTPQHPQLGLPSRVPACVWMTKRLLTDEAMSRVRCLKRVFLCDLPPLMADRLCLPSW